MEEGYGFPFLEPHTHTHICPFFFLFIFLLLLVNTLSYIHHSFFPPRNLPKIHPFHHFLFPEEKNKVKR
ncbi:hypothetical protein QVD17_01211 [Tagetes erecta]|uniref:Uncharacterized protein n=1 Tax=Tagetes erecta TaxID=13708 RepID=A0AAD8L6L3_TARER|nr:hypothetical protein QVD17_01211 [Tagetes erecta]